MVTKYDLNLIIIMITLEYKLMNDEKVDEISLEDDYNINTQYDILTMI